MLLLFDVKSLMARLPHNYLQCTRWFPFFEFFLSFFWNGLYRTSCMLEIFSWRLSVCNDSRIVLSAISLSEIDSAEIISTSFVIMVDGESFFILKISKVNLFLKWWNERQTCTLPHVLSWVDRGLKQVQISVNGIQDESQRLYWMDRKHSQRNFNKIRIPFYLFWRRWRKWRFRNNSSSQFPLYKKIK